MGLPVVSTTLYGTPNFPYQRFATPFGPYIKGTLILEMEMGEMLLRYIKNLSQLPYNFWEIFNWVSS